MKRSHGFDGESLSREIISEERESSRCVQQQAGVRSGPGPLLLLLLLLLARGKQEAGGWSQELLSRKLSVTRRGGHHQALCLNTRSARVDIFIAVSCR